MVVAGTVLALVFGVGLVAAALTENLDDTRKFSSMPLGVVLLVGTVAWAGFAVVGWVRGRGK